MRQGRGWQPWFAWPLAYRLGRGLSTSNSGRRNGDQKLGPPDLPVRNTNPYGWEVGTLTNSWCAMDCVQVSFWEEDFEMNEPGGLRYRRLQDCGLWHGSGVFWAGIEELVFPN